VSCDEQGRDGDRSRWRGEGNLGVERVPSMGRRGSRAWCGGSPPASAWRRQQPRAWLGRPLPLPPRWLASWSAQRRRSSITGIAARSGVVPCFEISLDWESLDRPVHCLVRTGTLSCSCTPAAHDPGVRGSLFALAHSRGKCFRLAPMFSTLDDTKF
jgi:hypothetical protein